MKKPVGEKYRNLFVYRDRIWYDRTVDGRRYRVNTGASTTTLEGWKEAASFRDQYEAAKKTRRARMPERCRRSPTWRIGIERKTRPTSQRRRGTIDGSTSQRKA